MRRKGGFDKGFLLLLVIVLILAGTGALLYAKVRTDKVAELVKKGKPFTVAIFVTDKQGLVNWRDVPQTSSAGPDGAPITTPAPGDGAPAKGSTPAATSSSGSGAVSATTKVPAENNQLLFTELFSYDPKTHKGTLLDVPGNVGSLINSIQKIDRIDVLFKPGKVDAYRTKIASLIGSPISLYLETDISEVPKIVDLLGGLNLFVPNPVDLPKHKPAVLLPSGSITFDGSKVESFLSYKATSDSDIEVISRRQRFVQSLLKTIGEQHALFGKPGVYSLFRSLVDTDMNRRSLVSFIEQMAKLDAQKMVFQRVLGVDRTVDNQQLLFPHYNGRLLRETMHQTLASLANPQVQSNEALTVRLQILNGTLITGLAHRTSQIFQSFGYDVVSVGNADRQDYQHTRIIDHTGNITQAQKVGSVIRCTQIESQPTLPSISSNGGKVLPTNPSVDVTLILGKDFDGRYCK